MIKCVDVRVGESIKIGDALLTVVSKSGQRARLRIEAKPEVLIGNPQRTEEVLALALRSE